MSTARLAVSGMILVWNVYGSKIEKVNSRFQISMQEEETKQEKWYENNALHIVVAAVSGILIALVVKTWYGGKVPDGVVILVGIVGTMWIQSLKAVVVPLIFCAMIQAVQVMKALKIGGAKKMIQSTVGYYLLTASTASLWGMFVALVIMKPQLGIIILDESVKPTTLPAKRTVFQQIEGLFLGFVPANIVGAFANNQVLAIISIALTIGYLIDSKTSAIYKAVVEIERMVYVIVDFLIIWSPIGILSLLASNIMNTDLVMLTGYTAVLVVCTIGALLWQFFINYPLIYFLVVRRNPFPLVGNMTAAALTAFGSASSAATMPGII